MEEILHQLIGSLSNYCISRDFCTCQVVQDFFHQQHVSSFFSQFLPHFCFAPMFMFFSQRSEEIIGKSRMWNEANEVSAKMETLFGKNSGEMPTNIFAVFLTSLPWTNSPLPGFQWQMKVSVGIPY